MGSWGEGTGCILQPWYCSRLFLASLLRFWALRGFAGLCRPWASVLRGHSFSKRANSPEQKVFLGLQNVTKKASQKCRVLPNLGSSFSVSFGVAQVQVRPTLNPGNREKSRLAKRADLFGTVFHPELLHFFRLLGPILAPCRFRAAGRIGGT